MVKSANEAPETAWLVIDRPILDLLNIHTGTPPDLSTDGRRLVVAPAEQLRKAPEVRDRAAHRTLRQRIQETR